MNQEKQPKEYDAVLGGNNPPPIDGLVLGGIEGVKTRLESNNIEVIKTALSDAIAHQDKGLDLVINALYNSPQEIRKHAVNILRKNKTAKAEQALLDYDPRSLFIQFDNWNLKNFHLNSYLDDPSDTAYRIEREQFQEIILNLEKIEPQGSKIECLYCPMLNNYERYGYEDAPFESFLKYLMCSYQQLTNLKALFLADNFLKDSPILKRLRILNLSRGTLTDEGAKILLNCSAINHLHTLDVSMNLLSSEMINKLSQLDCNVIAKPQDEDRYNEGCGRYRYNSLYE